MTDIIIRDATPADIKVFSLFNDNPKYILLNTIKAWVVEKDGKLACIAGVKFCQGYNEAFSDVVPNLRASKKQILKYAKILANKMKELNIPIVTIPTENPDSSRFLMAVGFKLVDVKRKIFKL